MLYEKKYFGNGQGNFDDVDFVLLPNQWVNLENARVGSTDRGVIGTIESVGSNLLLSSIQPSVTFVQIGAVADDANRCLYYFLKDLYGPWDKIVCYDLNGGVFYNVLFSAQVTGGLNFNKNYLIHSARVVSGLIYWTDNLNEPRRINIKAGINLNHPGTYPDVEPYSEPLVQEIITIIRAPMAFPISAVKNTNELYVQNYIANNAFQFSAQYEFRDGEKSVIGEWSTIMNYNFPQDEFNYITLQFPYSNYINQDVLKINLIVRFGNEGNSFIIKIWDRNRQSDENEINNHNTQITPLSFDFYNDISGIPVDAATANKPFDSVPLLSKTLEVGRNRLFLGNNLEGYDTPLNSSLTASVAEIEIGGTTSDGQYYELYYYYDRYEDTSGSYLGPGTPLPFYVLYVPSLSPVYYIINYGQDTPNPADISTSTGSYTYGTNVLSDFFSFFNDWLIANYLPAGVHPENGSIGSFLPYGGTVTVEHDPTSDNQALNVLKSNGKFRLSIVFYDKFRRKCGVVTSNVLVTVPYRTYTQNTFSKSISWALTNADNSEIPIWAYYYQIVCTRNLQQQSFIQARSRSVRYATKDTNGNFVFTTTGYSATLAGLGINIDALSSYGIGYSFTEGDIIVIYKSDNSPAIELAIQSQVGSWLVTELIDLGTVTTTEILYEIYTPFADTLLEAFYETAAVYTVINPTRNDRAYSVLTGNIDGDISLLLRDSGGTSYTAEAMSPNDKFWQSWQRNLGWINIVDTIGQQAKALNISYSAVLLEGTRVNGLSSFEALDETNLPLECGPISKLQVTSKVNNEAGTVMLAICETETASLYLGEAQLLSTTGNAFIAQSTGVIGTINILKGSFGTRNPESVTEFRGNAYWVDVLNGKVIQYSLNGLFPISNYKMTRYWKLFCDQYLAMTPEQIEALGSRPFIFTTVDPHHSELLITVPKLLNTPPSGYLPDPAYSSYIYPFDIWDGQAKTLVYKINAEPNFWQGSYSMTPEGFVTIQNRLYSFKNGQLYLHNEFNNSYPNFYCNFYGVQYTSRIMFICNQQPDRPKVYNNISIEANMSPTATYFMTLYPYTQVSNLYDFDFQFKEGVLYSQIYRNTLTPSATGIRLNSTITGEKMRTNALRVMLEFTVGTVPVELRFVTLGYQLSLGHSIPTQ